MIEHDDAPCRSSLFQQHQCRQDELDHEPQVH
uniref:Uncharacterized protein n=1 Tax=Arundo donax TaxID=35708 RepID=A0A0A9H688_ARUDO